MRSTESVYFSQVISRLAVAGLLTFLVTAVTPVVAQLAITCPADVSVPNDPGVCSAVVAYPAPIVSGAVSNITLTTIPASGSTFPVGINEVMCTVTDAQTNTASCSFTITVVDAEAPVIANASVNKSLLWPPNHKLVPVTVKYDLSDNCDAAPLCTLSVDSDESVDSIGDGTSSLDWEVLDAHHVLLRAERAGSGNGRLYTLIITCTDVNGNSTSSAVGVLVPHDKGKRNGGGQGKIGNGGGKGNGNGKGHGNGG